MTDRTTTNASSMLGDSRIYSKLPHQSASLFSKNGVLRKREVNFQNTLITDNSFLAPTPLIGRGKDDSKRGKASFKESNDLKRQFTSGLKKVQKSQLLFFFQFFLLLVSSSIRDKGCSSWTFEPSSAAEQIST